MYRSSGQWRSFLGNVLLKSTVYHGAISQDLTETINRNPTKFRLFFWFFICYERLCAGGGEKVSFPKSVMIESHDTSLICVDYI